jgi:hypothetical protein
MTEAESNLWARVYAVHLGAFPWWEMRLRREQAAEEADAAVALLRERVRA